MELDVKIKSTKPQHNSPVSTRCVNLYKTAPYGQLTIEQCEDLFRQRLEALHIIERADLTKLKDGLVSNKLRNIKSFVYKMNCIALRYEDAEQRRLDQFSHMLARMYCVYQSSLWPWFKFCERKLFQYRLEDQGLSFQAGDLEAILNNLNFNDCKRVSGPEFNELLRENVIGWNKRDSGRDSSFDIFRVRFIHATKFVSRRSVSLKDGYAYLTKGQVIAVVCDAFEKHLDSELQYAMQHLKVEALQAQLLLESMHMVHQDFQERIGDEKRAEKQDDQHKSPFFIDIENLDQLVKEHYPPCMRYLHESLMDDHHLKHSGRLYYGAFLRSGGIDLNTAIEFWRREFTKKIPNEKFERDYKYNIRHLYGKEGQKKALTCFSCDKIINDNPPGPSEKHGCPFRHFDETKLPATLKKYGLEKDVDVESVMRHVGDKQYKIACSYFFKFKRGHLPEGPFKSPAQFYFESRRLALMPAPTIDMAVDEEDEWDD